ncbi:MAG: hypothetical protein EXX96DRAFT_542255 [Benjaminiella poitrasii]|nr:MAG: hypothetical protein EXX96DRAFT_542255 [Benjaminiella poitrasii]
MNKERSKRSSEKTSINHKTHSHLREIITTLPDDTIVIAANDNSLSLLANETYEQKIKRYMLTEEDFPAIPPQIDRSEYPVEAISVFRIWLREHFSHPYPTQRQRKAMVLYIRKLVAEAGKMPIRLKEYHVDQWFYYARRKEWYDLLVIADEKFTKHTVDCVLEKNSKIAPRLHRYRMIFAIYKSRKRAIERLQKKKQEPLILKK